MRGTGTVRAALFAMQKSIKILCEKRLAAKIQARKLHIDFSTIEYETLYSTSCHSAHSVCIYQHLDQAMPEPQRPKNARLAEKALEQWEEFYEFIDAYILGMIPGTSLEKARCAAQRRKMKMTFSHYAAKYYLDRETFITIRKEIPFRKPEKTLIREILSECDSRHIFNDVYKNETAQGVITKAVSQCISEDQWEQVKYVIDLYSSWASQTYEGNRIAHAMGIDTGARVNPGVVPLDEARYDDALKVIGSSHDSLLMLDNENKIIGTRILSALSPTEESELLAPLAFGHIANWTTGSKIAIALTRNGEILLFKEKQLLFAKRRGAWRYFPHSTMLRRIISIPDTELHRALRKAIYLTALDVAFNRGGACLGVVKPDRDFEELLPGNCRLEDRALHQSVVGNKKFMDLPRVLRAELCAIDGATVLDHAGRLLCVGAILNTGGNAEGGGGRTAAARRMSDFGIGIKVSNDGFMTLYPYKFNATSAQTSKWG